MTPRRTRSCRRPAALAAALAAALLVAPALHAQQCFDPAPSLQGGRDPYQTLTPTRVSADGRKSIEALFKKLRGRWEGRAGGYFCRGTKESPRTEPDDFDIVMKATTSGTREISMVSELQSRENKKSRTETLRLFLTDSSLRVNRNDRAGEVTIESLSRGGGSIAFAQKEILSRAPGGAGFTEIHRRIEVGPTSLTMRYDVYLRGGLTSSTVWKLRKK